MSRSTSPAYRHAPALKNPVGGYRSAFLEFTDRNLDLTHLDRLHRREILWRQAWGPMITYDAQ